MIVDQPDESWQLIDLLLVTGIEFRESIASE
jgi:hypothetical protein